MNNDDGLKNTVGILFDFTLPVMVVKVQKALIVTNLSIVGSAFALMAAVNSFIQKFLQRKYRNHIA